MCGAKESVEFTVLILLRTVFYGLEASLGVMRKIDLATTICKKLQPFFDLSHPLQPSCFFHEYMGDAVGVFPWGPYS